MKYFSMIELLILTLLCICYAEGSPIARRQLTMPVPEPHCPCRYIRLVCPTQKKYFVVPVSWSQRSFACKIEESILDTALKQCDNTIMDLCKDKWVKEQNHCSIPVPILNEASNHVFHSACSLHDLCYLTLNANRDDCDEWFLDNMKQICSIKKLTRPLCLTSAYAMYRAVRQFGKPNFRRAQKWGKDHCIPE